MTPFRYGGFWDVPRQIILKYRGRLFFLASYFDEDLDDYEQNYSIRVLPLWVKAKLGESWKVLWENIGATLVGEIPVSSVVFDDTKRRFLDATFLDKYLD
jgi:hypothetical protein